MLCDAFGLSLEAESGERAVGGSVFTEILREEMLCTLEHAERYGWGV